LSAKIGAIVLGNLRNRGLPDTSLVWQMNSDHRGSGTLE
jgi:hypothetical protein